MLRLFLSLAICVLSLQSNPVRAYDGSLSDHSSSIGQHEQSSTSPVFFTKNMGQWPDSILYRTDAGGAVIWIAKNAIYYQFTRTIKREPEVSNSGHLSLRHSRGGGNPGSPRPDSIETMLIKATFVGANPDVQVQSEGERDFKFNYFLGNDPTKWATDVPNYQSVILQNLYPDVSLRLAAQSNGQIDYQVVAKSPAQAEALNMAFDSNLETLTDSDGHRLLKTAWGNSVQVIDPAKSLQGSLLAHTLSDQISRDIDAVPVSLRYSTFLGGSLGEVANGIAVDNSGCAYVSGWTQSINFPTQDAFDAIRNSTDVFVTKFSASGNALLYSTYLGGSTSDAGYGVAIDDFGCAYVTGETNSANFPTQNAYDASYNGSDDVFVTKFSASGNTLIYSTYLGGSAGDYGNGIAVDTAGSAYVTGSVDSPDFPTQNAYDAGINGSWTDVFVTKFSTSGSALAYSTYLGGSSSDLGQDSDYGWDIAVDDSGCAYVTGGTLSSDFPTQNAYDASPNGDWEIFVSKFSASGSALVYSTYLGGSGYDFGDNINSEDYRAYITGGTYSSDFPTQNAYDASHNGDQDIFVTELSTIGDALIYSTYLGGSTSEYGEGIAFDSSSNIYVVGYTNSSDFPMQNAFDASYNGINDVVVSKFSPSGSTLLYSTFMGGLADDNCYGIAVDSSGSAYVAGETFSTDFPTQNAYDAIHNGVRDVFVAKIIDCNSGTDSDLDGINDLCDNCPNTLNSNQVDTDGDLVGDACDNCPGNPNPSQQDQDNDLIGDACDACLDLSADTWSIPNNAASVWPTSHWNQFSYCQQPTPCGECCINCPSSDFPDWNSFASLVGEGEAYFDPPPGDVKFRPSAINQWRAIKGPWNGSCFGFATTYFLYLDGFRNLAVDFPGSADLSDVTISSGSRAVINKYYFYQYGFKQQQHSQSRSLYTPNQTLSECKEMFYATPRNDRVLMMFNQNGTGAHSLAPYRCLPDGGNPNLWYLYVHDSNFPADTSKRIAIDATNNTWSYSGQPSWGGSKGLFLMDSVSAYMNPLVVEDNGTVPQVMTVYFGETDSANFVAPLFGVFGFNADSLFGEIPGSHPIIPADGQETSPIGYYLPTTYFNYQIVGVESGQCIINYGNNIQWRVGGAKSGIISAAVTAAAENLTVYAGAAKSLQETMAVCDTEFVELLMIEPDSEIVIQIQDIDIAPGDSIRYTLVGGLVRISNYGAATDYDLSVQVVSATTDAAFYHADIPITPNTSHTIHFDWRASNDSVHIDVDSARNGSIESTIIIADQPTPVFRCGDANGNGGVSISDVVFLINYIFSGGAAPNPVRAGDANCSGAVTISDAVFLINYIFSGGASPCAVCP